MAGMSRLALAAGAAAAVAGAAHAASNAELTQAFNELRECTVDLRACVVVDLDGNSQFFKVLRANSQQECLQLGSGSFQVAFVPTFNNANAFINGVNSVNDDQRFVRLSDGVTAKQARTALENNGAVVEDFLVCDGSIYIEVQASEADVEINGVVDFNFRIPSELRLGSLIDGVAQNRLSAKSNIDRASSSAKSVPNIDGTFRTSTPSKITTKAVFSREGGKRLGTAAVERFGARVTSTWKTAQSALLVNVEDATAEDIEWLSKQWGVRSVERAGGFVLHNRDAAPALQSGFDTPSNQGLDAVDSNLVPFWQLGIRGQGQIVGVADSGLDTQSCFFSDSSFNEANLINQRNSQAGSLQDVANLNNHRKVVSYIPFADGSDNVANAFGHGSHVAGSIAGVPQNVQDNAQITDNDRNPSGQQMPAVLSQGMAPDAKLAFFDIGVSNGALLVPDDVTAIFRSAADAGARIHSNSWGLNVLEYSSFTRDIDEFMFENQDFLILFAAGNSGAFGQSSIGEPATGKNLLSVGATVSPDGSFGFVEEVFGGDLCGLAEGCAENMAVFSSQGPTLDNRIKPDVVAPGQFIFSVGASDSGSATCEVAPLAGTSMATPVTAGSLALARQFLVDGFHPSGQANAADGFTPMAALLKAIAVNSAEFLSGSVGINGNIQLGTNPDSFQGFGRPKLDNTLLFGNSLGDRQVILDGDFDNMSTFTASGQTKTYKITLPDNSNRLRATLAWVDPPSSRLQANVLVNDLDILVTSPDGDTFRPNGLAQADTLNTIESVDLSGDAVVAGEYTITVTATRLGRDDVEQPFAVAISGGIFDDVLDDDELNIAVIAGVAAASAVTVFGGAYYIYKTRRQNASDVAASQVTSKAEGPPMDPNQGAFNPAFGGGGGGGMGGMGMGSYGGQPGGNSPFGGPPPGGNPYGGNSAYGRGF